VHDALVQRYVTSGRHMFFLRSVPSHGGSMPPSNTRLLGLTRVCPASNIDCYWLKGSDAWWLVGNHRSSITDLVVYPPISARPREGR